MRNPRFEFNEKKHFFELRKVSLALGCAILFLDTFLPTGFANDLPLPIPALSIGQPVASSVIDPSGGQQQSPSADRQNGSGQQAKCRVIPAHISLVEPPKHVGQLMENFMDAHCQQSPDYQALQQKVEHYRKAVQKTIAVTKDSLDFSFHVKGVGPSRNAARQVLDEQTKICDLPSAEFERQKYVDQLHQQIVSAMMQVCESRGTADLIQRQQLLAEAVAKLETIAGPQEAIKIIRGLDAWLETASVTDKSFAKTPWSSIERDQRLSMLVRSALDGDPVVSKIKTVVSKYACPGKIKSGISQVLDTTLSIGAMAPGMVVSWASEAALNAYVMKTGGSEESKLEKELLLYKRIQSRISVLTNEASQALDNYRFALITRNRQLLAFSGAVMEGMSNATVANDITKTHPATDTTTIVPQLGDYMPAEED